jgi:hypothetical protein
MIASIERLMAWASGGCRAINSSVACNSRDMPMMSLIRRLREAQFWRPGYAGW